MADMRSAENRRIIQNQQQTAAALAAAPSMPPVLQNLLDSIQNQPNAIAGIINAYKSSPTAGYQQAITVIQSFAANNQMYGATTTNNITSQLPSLISEAQSQGLSTGDINASLNAGTQIAIANIKQNAAELAANDGPSIGQLLTVAAIAAAPFTGGASLAVGETLLGAGAVGAATLGSAVIGSATSALLAAANGGDIGKAAITGAIGGGVGAATPEAMASIVGGGDSIAGMAKIADVANAAGMSTSQVSGLISNALSTTLATAATGGDTSNLLEKVANSLASTAIGNYAGNITASILPDDLSKAANVAGAVGKIGTSATLNNQDFSTALTNNIGNIIGAAAQPTKYTDIANLVSNTNSSNALPITSGATQVADITQDPNYKTAIEAGFDPESAKALAQGMLDPTLPAYSPLAANGTVTVTDVNNPNAMPLVSTATVEQQKQFIQEDLAKGLITPEQAAAELANLEPTVTSSPLDTTLSNVIENISPVTTKPATINNPSNIASISNTVGVNDIASNAITNATNTGTGGVGTSIVAGTGIGGTGTGGAGTGTSTGGGTGVTGLSGTGTGGTTTNYSTSYSIPATSSANSTTYGALPGNLQSTSLAAAPLQEISMNLQQLKQLYPQLSTIDPRLLNTLMGKNAAQTTTPEFGGATGLSAIAQGGKPAAGYPAQAASNASATNFASTSPMSGSFDALTSAGLKSLSGASNPYGLKDGGQPHIPQFKTGTTGHYVQGAGDGQSDDIPAMLADGEYVFDADTVASLGNGSNKAGALQLDKMREAIRKHKRAAPHNKIPPKAKSPLEYMKGK